MARQKGLCLRFFDMTRLDSTLLPDSRSANVTLTGLSRPKADS